MVCPLFLGVDNRACSALLIGARSIGVRADVLLKQRWKVLRHVTLSVSKIGAIIVAAQVITPLERGTR